MNRILLAMVLALALRGAVGAYADDLPKPADSDQLQTGPEAEQKEATTAADVAPSTDVLTPITPFSERDLHQQALDELIKANNLFAQNQNEAASDLALQAYDDLMTVRTKRKGHDRAKVLSERHQAATTYIQAGIAYIQEFAKRSGNSATAQDETRARFEDLRDIAREYPELTKKLDQALAAAPAPPAP